MRKSAKKVLSGLLAALMVVSAAPISALAADYEVGQEIEQADMLAPGAISPKLDIVWTEYGYDAKAKAAKVFHTSAAADANWVADGETINDPNTISVEGQTVGADDCTMTPNSKGEYFVAASFILKDFGGQFGCAQWKFGWDTSKLTVGERKNANTGWSTTAAQLQPGTGALMDIDWNPYLLDGGSVIEADNAYLCVVPLDGVCARWIGDTTTLDDPESGYKIEGMYLTTIGFKVAAGTVISDDLFQWDYPNVTIYSSSMAGFDEYATRQYTRSGYLDNQIDPAAGVWEIPMKADVPPTPTDHTVTFDVNGTKTTATVADGAALTADQIPALPEKAPDANGHYSYAWDGDTSAVITADTTFTAVETATAHTEKAVDSNVVDPDCGNAGSKTVTTYCEVCDYVINVQDNVEIPATGNHTAGEAVKEDVNDATCGQDGSHNDVVYCTVCGEKLSSTPAVDKATGNHTAGEPVRENEVPAQVGVAGSYDEVVYCTVCNQELSRVSKEIPALDGVTVTVNATDMGTVTLDDKDATDGAFKKYALNGSYTLTATPAAGCTFVGWQVGGKVVSTAATYTPVAVADVTYTPVFVDSTKDITVIYMGLFNNVIATQTVKDAAELQAPIAPTYTGYTFTGWSADLSTITESTTVYAQYDKDAAAAYTVTADGATITSAAASGEGTLADVPYGAQVTVTKEGVKAWTIDGAVVAYGDTYSFAVASDVTLVAVEDAVDTAPVVAAVATNRVAGSAKVEFLATRDVPAGYEFVNAGWVYGKNLTADELALANVGKTGAAADAGQVKATYVASTEANAQFILSYGIAAQQGSASAKAFLTVKNTATGEIQTVYSDAMVYTY